MSGFWQPIFHFFQRLLSNWANFLLSGLPVGVRPYFRMIGDLEPVAIEGMSLESFSISSLQEKNVALYLKSSVVLTHQFTVSREALRDIKNAVRLEVERALPITSSELIHAYRVNKVAESDLSKVTVFAVRRHLLDQLFIAAKQAGRTIEDVFLYAGGNDNHVRLPLDVIRRRKWLRGGVALVLLGAIVFIASIFPGVYMGRLQEAINDTDMAIVELRQKTAKIAGLQRQVRKMQNLAQAVYDQRHRAQILDLFVQLTDASPDTIVFEELRLDGSRLFIRGTALAPEEWVLSLQENPAFRNVTLESVLGIDKDQARRFEIRLDAVWPNDRGREG
ncbi:MAG: PilN domain-containing protein [Alphaproteobacteria bacterium]|nr:PilN domain-containing protein [Alphaproteobacteria bacterium]